MRKQNPKMKWIASLLISQLALCATPGFSAETAAPTSPEETLLVTAITAGGENLSQSQLTEALAQAVSTYNQTAPLEGREDRLVQAMSEMNIVDSQAAQAFEASLDESLQSAVATNAQAPSEKILESALENALSREQGAEFSSCDASNDVALGGFAVGIVGALVALAGATVGQNSYDNCTEVEGPHGVREVCEADPGNSTARAMEIYGGIAAGIGAVAIVASFALHGKACD